MSAVGSVLEAIGSIEEASLGDEAFGSVDEAGAMTASGARGKAGGSMMNDSCWKKYVLVRYMEDAARSTVSKIGRHEDASLIWKRGSKRERSR